MNRKSFYTFILVLILAGAVAVPAGASAGVQSELAQVRRATALFHDVAAAEEAGYLLLPTYNICVFDPELGAMGYHYINVSLMDTSVDPLHPEAMVYVPDQSGELQFASVEYIVPKIPWDTIHSEPPTLFGETFNYNPAKGVYALHAWIWIPNPAGMFASYNPRLSCD